MSAPFYDNCATAENHINHMQTIMGTPANMDDRTVVITIVHNPCNEAMCEVQNHLIEMRWPNPPFARSLPRNRRGFYPNAQGMTNRFRGI